MERLERSVETLVQMEPNASFFLGDFNRLDEREVECTGLTCLSTNQQGVGTSSIGYMSQNSVFLL